ncbi:MULTISPECIES: hypothetical protein [Rhizobium]|uniref:Uncharacterized protein n=1 Tax=Rhizobium metallidurans TaxID=1265931 RepID=A0A7W6CND1_9HYPH|nr:hypothetical protein [Rhizobium sp. AN80A]MBB3964183.1 hypothetical protein [Rhizobium metallidurans]
MSIFAWVVLFSLLALLALVAVRMSSKHEAQGLDDAGFAIIEFNRAFPTEAIRSLQATANGEVVFVRLHDNKTGFMRNMQRHYSCQVIQPGRVRVQSSDTGKGLTLEFLDARHQNGTFEFASPKEASEVALWLLGNYVAEPDRELPLTDPTAANHR